MVTKPIHISAGISMPRKLRERDMTYNDLILNLNYGQSLDRGFWELLVTYQSLCVLLSGLFFFLRLLNTRVKLKTKVRK